MLQRGRAQLSAESELLSVMVWPYQMLQRGRAQLSAERSNCNFRAPSDMDASTRPRSIERGEFINILWWYSCSMLQRGRAQLSAERDWNTGDRNTGYTLQRGRAQLSAESAALNAWVNFQRELQRGRAQLSAESQKKKSSRNRTFRASTRPRSIERGESSCLPFGKKSISSLQRGRAQLSAERFSINTLCVKYEVGFNEAALN